MKSIEITRVTKEVKKLLVKASFSLPADIREAVELAIKREPGRRAKDILKLILENEQISGRQRLPLCQDCGLVYIDMDIGRDVIIEKAGELNKQINRTVADTYNKNYLRKSVVNDPLYKRKNTSDNTPAIIHTSFTGDSGIHIKLYLKGGGSENCSALYMLDPSAGEERIMELVVKRVREIVTKCCPPVILGIGIGGSSSEVTQMARVASFRNIKKRNPDKKYEELEGRILEAVNKTGIGPQGLGGETTALACNIEYAPCHMATLPLAIFMGCHSMRRADSKISPP
ncbi:MAG: fumarate hydratase [Actinomycetota bacterium]|nr:fumarate hydratase [Actinomycetota bacterium]